MKPNFDKILVERERIGHSMKYRDIRRKNNRKDYEDMPYREGMQSVHKKVGRDWKYLNENLSPLRRYLEKQVGRSWNTVYSEIRKMIGKNPNAVKGHILQHLFGWGGVYLHTETYQGKRYQKNGAYYSGSLELSDGELFVDEQGIVRKYKRKGKKKTYAQIKEELWMQTARNLPDGNQAHKINGVWFYVTLSPIEDKHIYTQTYKTTYGNRTYQVVLVNDVFGTRGEVANFTSKYGKNVFASSKRSMNKAELKKYELLND
jgi:hypothetical protein